MIRLFFRIQISNLFSFLLELKSEPIEGFAIELEDESNLFEWTIWVEGPKDTLYDGGIFKMKMTFPTDFPMIPPELKFISDFWHPNSTKKDSYLLIEFIIFKIKTL